MSMYLDIRTLIVTGVCICFLLSSTLFLFRRTERAVRGIGSWGSGFLVLGIAYGLLSLRGMIADFLSIVVANTLLVVCLVLLYRGLRKFEGERPGEPVSIVSALVNVAGFLYFTYIIDSMAARIAILTLSSSVVAIQIGCFLVRKAPPLFRRAYRTEGGIFFLIAATMIARALYTFGGPQTNDLMTAGIVHGIVMLASTVFAFTMVFGFLWIVDQKTEEMMVQMAITDPLTGLFNRRHTLDRLEEEMERTIRFTTPLGLIMLDLDNLKAINDGYGHLAGDEVLRGIGASLRKSIRKYDIVGRYGGDEFLVVLPNTDLDTSLVLAERIRKAAADASLEGITASISVGVTSASSDDTTIEDLIRRADDALYAAKSQGKNHVHVASLR